MKKSTMTSAITGMAVAMAAGTAAYMAAENKNKFSTKKLKKSAGKAMKAVESTIQNISGMMMK